MDNTFTRNKTKAKHTEHVELDEGFIDGDAVAPSNGNARMKAKASVEEGSPSNTNAAPPVPGAAQAELAKSATKAFRYDHDDALFMEEVYLGEDVD